MTILTPIANSIQYGIKTIQVGGVGAQLVDKLYRIYRMAFDVSQGVSLAVFGAKAISWDGIRQLHQLKKKQNDKQVGKINESLRWFYDSITSYLSRLAETQITQGLLYTTSGICCLLEGLHTLNFIKLGNMLPIVNSFGNGSFLFANILVLGNYIKIYRDINKIMPKAESTELQILKNLQTSVITGIISNVAYLISVSTLMFGGPVALVIVFGVLGVVFSLTKILFDVLKLKEQQLVSD